MIARCGHQQMKNAEACIVEIIGENNLDHFFVGTQDTDIRKKFQERHARSEKLMKENRLQVMLNSDGEIENMDEETHAERHARTVALAQANGRLRFKPVSKSFNAGSKDCSKMVILHASNDNKTQAAIARLEALENDYTGMETVEAVDDDESSLEDEVYIQKKQKDTKHKTRQVKALENARKAPRNFLELLHEIPSVVALRRLAARRRKEPTTRQELEVKTAHDEEQATWQPEEERILQHAKSSTPKINKEEKPAHDQDRLCSLDSPTHASRHLQASYTTGLASSTTDFHPNGTRQKLPTSRDQPQTETSHKPIPARKRAQLPRHASQETQSAPNREQGGGNLHFI